MICRSRLLRRGLHVLLSLLGFCSLVTVSPAAITGFLKIPDIPGESQRADHEDEIDIHGFHWEVLRPASALEGSGRTTSRAEFKAISFSKYYDASSPYLFLACANGKNFDEIVFTVRKDSGDAHLDYLTITMTNCVVTSYRAVADGETTTVPREQVSLNFERIRVKYIVQEDDHSAGDEHEVEYDIAAGA